jgi:tetratricopeptide (TPR) repeat protein
MAEANDIIEKALTLKGKGEYEKSIELIKKLFDKNKNSEKIKTLLKKLLFDYGGWLMDNWVIDYSKTRKCYQEIIDLEPKNYRAIYNLGISLFSLGKKDEALIKFKEALKLNPEYKFCHYNIGLVYEDKGLLERAYNAYKRALEIDPNFLYAKEAKKIVEDKLNDRSRRVGQGSEKNKLEQLKSLFRVSKKINITDMLNILNVKRAELMPLIIEWAEEYEFEIDGDYLILNKKTLSEFLENISLNKIY